MATESSRESLIGVFRRQPQATQLLVKLGLGAPVVIVVWDWVALLFLPAIAVVPITLALVILFGTAMTVLAAHLVYSIDRWEVDSALQARRLWTTRGAVADRSGGVDELADAGNQAAAHSRRPPAPAPSLSFSRVYFDLRLQEEIRRCRREGSSMSLIYIDAQDPSHEQTAGQLEKTIVEVANLASQHTQTISLPLHTGPSEYAFVLPHSERDAADDFASKLVRALGDYWCHFGVAVYPDDGSNAEELFDYAREECDESRQGKSRPKRQQTFGRGRQRSGFRPA